jgi:ribosomal protein S18 acetylase RimI-like enzyme
MNYEIRDATLADSEIIASYNSQMAVETEGRPLDANIIGPGVSNLLNDPNKGRYWVATVNDEVIGQIMVTYEWSDWRNGTLWWIQSVYVHPDHRRSGVFSALYQHVKSLAQDNGARGLRLYVEHNNERAQKTYETLGMVNPNYQVMEEIFGDTKC